MRLRRLVSQPRRLGYHGFGPARGVGGRGRLRRRRRALGPLAGDGSNGDRGLGGNDRAAHQHVEREQSGIDAKRGTDPIHSANPSRSSSQAPIAHDSTVTENTTKASL